MCRIRAVIWIGRDIVVSLVGLTVHRFVLKIAVLSMSVSTLLRIWLMFRRGRGYFFASKGLARPELVFDVSDMPMIFQPDFENEFCCISYERAKDTQIFLDPADSFGWETVTDQRDPFEDDWLSVFCFPEMLQQLEIDDIIE